MVEGFLGKDYRKITAYPGIREDFEGGSDDKSTRQTKFGKKSNEKSLPLLADSAIGQSVSELKKVVQEKGEQNRVAQKKFRNKPFKQKLPVIYEGLVLPSSLAHLPVVRFTAVPTKLLVKPAGKDLREDDGQGDFVFVENPASPANKDPRQDPMLDDYVIASTMPSFIKQPGSTQAHLALSYYRTLNDVGAQERRAIRAGHMRLPDSVCEIVRIIPETRKKEPSDLEYLWRAWEYVKKHA